MLPAIEMTRHQQAGGSAIVSTTTYILLGGVLKGYLHLRHGQDGWQERTCRYSHTGSQRRRVLDVVEVLDLRRIADRQLVHILVRPVLGDEQRELFPARIRSIHHMGDNGDPLLTRL